MGVDSMRRTSTQLYSPTQRLLLIHCSVSIDDLPRCCDRSKLTGQRRHFGLHVLERAVDLFRMVAAHADLRERFAHPGREVPCVCAVEPEPPHLSGSARQRYVANPRHVLAAFLALVSEGQPTMHVHVGLVLVLAVQRMSGRYTDVPTERTHPVADDQAVQA